MQQSFLAKEIARAESDFGTYAKHILVEPTDDSTQAHKQAMLQSVLRLQFLRIHAGRMLADFFDLPQDTSVLKTEEYVLNMAAQQIAASSVDPEKTLREIELRFQPAKETVASMTA